MKNESCGPEVMAGLAHCLGCGEATWDPAYEEKCFICGSHHWALLPDDPALVPAALSSIEQQVCERQDRLEREGWLDLEITFGINIADECRPRPA